MKKLLPLFGLLLLLACQKEHRIRYDLTYGQTSPSGGIEHFTQTKVVEVDALPQDEGDWIDLIQGLEHFHDLEDGIQDDLYWGHIFWVDNFYFL